MNRKDATFLKSVDNDRNKVTYVRVTVLDKYEKPIKLIEGRVLDGSSISLNGTSSMRRTCTLNLIADEDKNDLTDLDNFLSINKKIKLEIGQKYNLDYDKDIEYRRNSNEMPVVGNVGKIYVNQEELTYWYWDTNKMVELNSIFDYPETVIWFPQGIYVITQPTISHSLSGVNISLNLKDKMCLLNGEMAGGLPTSITFHEYDQTIGEVVCLTNPKKDPNLNLNEYTIYRYVESVIDFEHWDPVQNSDNPPYKNEVHYYKWTRKYGWEDSDGSEIGTIIHVPQLFYDIIQTVVVRFGNEDPARVIINDVPREIKQLVRWTSSKPLYFNTKTGVYTTDELYLTNEGVWRTFLTNEDVGYVYTDFTFPGELISNIGDNVCSVLDKIIAQLGNYEYFYDIDGNFVFQEKRNYLNTSYLPTEIAYDTQRFYLDNNWKGNENDPIVLDNNTLKIIGKENFEADYYGDQKSIYNFGDDSHLISSYNNSPNFTGVKNDYHIWGKNDDGYAIHYHLAIKEPPKPNVMTYKGFPDYKWFYSFPTRQIVYLPEDGSKYDGRIRLAKQGENGINFTPEDWRAELYLQGLEIQRSGGRPDIYQQELLDLFDSIYEFGYYDSTQQWIPRGRFKADITQRPNSLQYFLDYLEPTDNLYDISIDEIGTKMFSYQQDKIIRLYDNEVPDYILLDESMDNDYELMVMNKCDSEGQKHNVISKSIYANLAIGTKGYSAQETVRSYLYQYSNYNESISLQCIPIYYLDVNRRITVKDKVSGINGDYIINTITMPLSSNSMMSINATRALNRLPMDYRDEEQEEAEIFIDNNVLYINNFDFEIDPPAIKDNVGIKSIIDDNTEKNKTLVWATDDNKIEYWKAITVSKWSSGASIKLQHYINDVFIEESEVIGTGYRIENPFYWGPVYVTYDGTNWHVWCNTDHMYYNDVKYEKDHSMVEWYYGVEHADYRFYKNAAVAL